MSFDLTPINVKNSVGDPVPMIAYKDGSNSAFANAAVNSTGAIINPATADNQTTANSALATIATQTNGVATATKQDTGNTALAAIATSTASVDTNIGAKADAAATSDTGAFSLISLLKRLLQTTTTLASRTPALGSALSAASTPVVIASDQAALPLPTGAATSAKQDTGNASLATIATNTAGLATSAKQDSMIAAAGAPADTSATSDTGTFSLIALVKRGLTNWTTLLAKMPTLVGGRIPVDGSGVTQPVAAAANSTGGASVYAATGSGAGNALLAGTVVSVKAAPGNLYGVAFVNTGASAAYVQLFDVSSGSVVPGTTAPKMVFWVPAGGAWEEKFTGEAKVAFNTAISAVATTGATNGAAATGVIANIVYQ